MGYAMHTEGRQIGAMHHLLGKRNVHIKGKCRRSDKGCC